MDIGTSKVTAKGQLTIPQNIREKMGLLEGTPVVIMDTDSGILIRKSSDLKDFFAPAQQWAKEQGITRKDVRGLVRDEKKRTLKRVQSTGQV